MIGAQHIDRQFDWLRISLLSALWLPLLLIVYAGCNDIVLFLDAAYYLYQNLMRQDFALIEPSSRTVQVLQQLPVVALIQLSVDNLTLLKVVAGSWNLLLPLLLTWMAYLVLPQQAKWQFVFPLAAYVAGALVSFFPTITDAPAAAAYFWLLLVMVLYAERWRYGSWLTLVLAVPAGFVHESMVFLGPLLLAAAWLRWLAAETVAQRWIYALLMLVFVFVTLLAMSYIIEPRSVANRSGFLTTLLGFRWYVWPDGSFNVAALLSVYGLPLMFLFWLGYAYAPVPRKRHYVAVLVGVLTLVYGLFALLLLLLQAQEIIAYSIFAQFAARAHATLVSFPLGIMLLLSWSRKRSGSEAYLRGMAILLLLISLATCVAHAYGIQRWNSFLQAYANTLQQRAGYVSWQQAFASVPDMYHLGSGWTNPLMSLFLSEQGMVTTIIDNRDPQRKAQAFDPCAAGQLPQSKYFDFSAYQRHLHSGVCRGQAQQFAAASADADFPTIVVTTTRRPSGLASSSGWQPSPKAYRDRAGWNMLGARARLELDRALPQQYVLQLRLATWGRAVGNELIVRSGGSEARVQLAAGTKQYRITLRLSEPAAAVDFVLPAWLPDAQQAMSAAEHDGAVGVALFELDIEPAVVESRVSMTADKFLFNRPSPSGV